MDYKQALIFLNSFINYEHNLADVSPVNFRLDRVKRLLKALGNPEKDLRVTHIAGSKGKGSTAAFVAQILKEADYKVGLFTSPHIKDVRERIRILDSTQPIKRTDDIFDDMISREEFRTIIEETKNTLEQFRNDNQLGDSTFFEALTALALYYFNKNQCDFVILETGVGGRLDATNAVDSMIAAITPISLEHTHLLGDTLEAIAREKAAIIKDESQKVIIAPQESEVLDVLTKRCDQFAIVPKIVGKDITYKSMEGSTFDCHTENVYYKDLELSLAGRHQMENASLAIGIIEALQEFGFPVCAKGISDGLKNTYWPGRFELISEEPTVILDGAHNFASSKVLIDTIEEMYPQKDVTMIVGLSQEKDAKSICTQFNRVAKTIVATKSDHPRALELSEDDLENYFPTKQCYKKKNVKEALDFARKHLKEDDILLVSGSLYLVSEARSLCTN